MGGGLRFVWFQPIPMSCPSWLPGFLVWSVNPLLKAPFWVPAPCRNYSGWGGHQRLSTKLCWGSHRNIWLRATGLPDGSSSQSCREFGLILGALLLKLDRHLEGLPF